MESGPTLYIDFVYECDHEFIKKISMRPRVVPWGAQELAGRILINFIMIVI